MGTTTRGGPTARCRRSPEVGDQRVVGEHVGAQVEFCPLRLGELERPVQRPGHEADGDAVHHDRRHDLVRAGLHLEDRRDRRVDHAAEHREEQHRDRPAEQPGQEVEVERRPRRRHHADEVLALHADVEQPALEAHGDRERGEDQRGRDREDRGRSSSASRKANSRIAP